MTRQDKSLPTTQPEQQGAGGSDIGRTDTYMKILERRVQAAKDTKNAKRRAAYAAKKAANQPFS